MRPAIELLNLDISFVSLVNLMGVHAANHLRSLVYASWPGRLRVRILVLGLGLEFECVAKLVVVEQ